MMINIDVACAAVMEDYVFFSALEINALLRMDLLSGKTECVCRFEKEKGSRSLHGKAFCYGKQIWFIPLFGEFIACYHTDRKEMEYFEVPKRRTGTLGRDTFWLHTNEGDVKPVFSDAGRFDDHKLYLVPAVSDAVIILDMKTGSLTPFYDVIDVENELMGCGAICGDQLWMAPYIGNQLICLDMKTGEKERHKCTCELGCYFGICALEENLWFSLHDKGRILIYNTLKKQFRRTDMADPENGSQIDPYRYRDIFSFNGNIWMLPAESERIILVNPTDGRITGIYPPEKVNLGTMVGMEAHKNGVFFYSYAGVMDIDHDGKITAYKVSIDENEFLKVCRGDSLTAYCNCFVDVIPEEKLGLLNYVEAVKNRKLQTKSRPGDEIRDYFKLLY